MKHNDVLDHYKELEAQVNRLTEFVDRLEGNCEVTAKTGMPVEENDPSFSEFFSRMHDNIAYTTEVVRSNLDRLSNLFESSKEVKVAARAI